jgi:hypothetical protein
MEGSKTLSDPAKTMRLTRSDKTNVIAVVAIAVGACLVWWFLKR